MCRICHISFTFLQRRVSFGTQNILMEIVDRVPIFPTQGTRILTKCRLSSAQRGHDLLRKKAESLLIRFRSVVVRLLENRSQIERVMREASFSLAEVKYVAGDISQYVLQSVDKAKIKIVCKEETIAGVKVRRFECYETGVNNYEYAGLARGGQQVIKLKKNYGRAIELLVELASLQNNFVALEEVLRTTNRRVNALRHVFMPRLERTLSYVSAELEEREREEFYRMKRVQDKKRALMKGRNRNDNLKASQESPSDFCCSVEEDLLF